MGSSFPKHTHMCAALITFHPSCCKSLEDFTAGDCHLHETSKFLTLFLSQPSWYFHLPRGGVFLSPGKTMPEVFFSCQGGWPWGWLWDSKGLGMGPSLTVLWSYSLWGKIWNNTESSNSNNNGPIRAVSDHCKNRGPGPKGPGKRLSDGGRDWRRHSRPSRGPRVALISLPCGLNYSNILVIGRILLDLCSPSLPTSQFLHLPDIRHGVLGQWLHFS